MSKTAKDRIIVALDVPIANEAQAHIEELSGHVGAFKIGLQLFTSAGPRFVREVVSKGTKLFLDVKFHDIPITVAKASIEAARLGVWMFNIHASGGGEMIKKTVESVEDVCESEGLVKPKIIGVTVLTSSNQTTLAQIGVKQEINQQVLTLAKLSDSFGLDGVVASPNESKMIRKGIDNQGFLIVTPGVRLKQIQDDDQKRVMTPYDAVANGSDYLVIGRPILQAKDKIRATEDIIKNIEGGT